MKKIFLKLTAQNKTNSIALLILRLSAGGLMLTHGWGKFQKVINGNLGFADPLGIGEELSLYLTVFAEFFCAIFILVGLFTRLASIPLIITMAVAAFIIHGGDPIGDKEASLGYLAVYLAIFFMGPGRLSIDSGILKN